MGQIIDGKNYAEIMLNDISKQVSFLKTKHQVTPGLAVVLVGTNPASQVYVNSKKRKTTQSGMNSFEHILDESVSEQELISLIEELNDDNQVHGILVQLPLPTSINSERVINTINVEKDVDGFHIENVGKLAIGAESLVPCTPTGCLILLKSVLKNLKGLHAVVVGRSNIVGKPVAALLLQEDCTVTIAHSKTKDLPEVIGSADIVVAAVGLPEMIKGEWIKPGATVIDVGINRISDHEGNRLVGDVDFNEVKAVAAYTTPVPGGVGPMTIACLLRNTLIAACRQHSIATTF